MFYLCLKYGIVPNTFCQGLLVPLLKKPTLDTILTQHCRHVTVSWTLLKLLELYILDVSSYHEFSDLPFGFVVERGTNIIKWTFFIRMHFKCCCFVYVDVSYISDENMVFLFSYLYQLFQNGYYYDTGYYLFTLADHTCTWLNCGWWCFCKALVLADAYKISQLKRKTWGMF